MKADLPKKSCVFCRIISGDSIAKWEKHPTNQANAVCFHNRLKWAEVMLLVVPVKHMTQGELWSSNTLIECARLAVEMGDKHCSQHGYRPDRKLWPESASKPNPRAHTCSLRYLTPGKRIDFQITHIQKK